MIDKEKDVVWKTYPKYPFIEANQFGEIRTVDRIVIDRNGVKRFRKGHVLKQCEDHNGYLRVNTRVNGKSVHLLVHQVVASSFFPNPDNLPEVNHKDNNPKNNSAENLEFCTRKYNIAYREKYGKSAAKVFGRSVFAIDLKTSEVSRFESQHEAARQLGLSPSHINDVLKGRLKQTGGFWFCYADSEAVEKARTKFGDKAADEVEKLTNEL